jgi:hypothetical protein
MLTMASKSFAAGDYDARDYNRFTAIVSDVVMGGGFKPIYIHRSGDKIVPLPSFRTLG